MSAYAGLRLRGEEHAQLSVGSRRARRRDSHHPSRQTGRPARPAGGSHQPRGGARCHPSHPRACRKRSSTSRSKRSKPIATKAAGESRSRQLDYARLVYLDETNPIASKAFALVTASGGCFPSLSRLEWQTARVSRSDAVVSQRCSETRRWLTSPASTSRPTPTPTGSRGQRSPIRGRYRPRCMMPPISIWRRALPAARLARRRAARCRAELGVALVGDQPIKPTV